MKFQDFHNPITLTCTKHLFYFLFAFFTSLPCQAFSGKYPIQNFTPSDYKAGIQNIDFAQNRDMTLFVANNLGILSYSGKSWERHSTQTGKKQRSLAFDEKADRLYFGSQGEFGYFDGDWNMVSLVEKIPDSAPDFDEVWDVFLLNDKVYFCTFQGIFVFNGQSVSFLTHQDGFYRSFRTQGKLFAQSRQGQLLEIKDEELLISPALRNSGREPIAGVIAQEGGFLVLYNSGKVEFVNAFGALRKYDNLVRELEGKYVNHVLQLSDTRLAISTQTAGLFLFDLQKQTIENITSKDGLLSNACLSTFQDYSGNLWVGMQNGIALIDLNSPMRFFNQEINIQGSGYEAYKREEGTYYTTSNGIYFLAKNVRQSQFIQGTEGPAYGMQSIAGKLYAGHHTGLFLLANGTAKRVANTPGLWQVKQLQSNPEFAIGGTYSGLFLFRMNQNMELQGIGKISGFEESSRFFEEDREGKIWVGQFYKGLYQLSLSPDLTSARVHKVSAAEGLPVAEQIVLSRIDNELYLGTPKGIYTIDQSRHRIVKSEMFSKVIGEQQVYLLTQDNQKNVHVYTEEMAGFFRQISADNYTFVPSSVFQMRYSFNNDLLNISVHTDHGVLFNANEGFIQYRPELENRLADEKPLMVSKVVNVAEDSILYERNPFGAKPDDLPQLTVSYRAKVIQFDVEAFQFNGVSNQQYRYYLKGFDEGPGEWTPATTKEYTNLREGTYEFSVQTKNFLGQITTSKPIQLRVNPPFYRSLFAWILYLALGIWSLVLVSRLQKRRYQQKVLDAEKAKEQELQKKQQQLIAIEHQKEQAVRQIEEDKMKSELRHLNSLMAASTMNLVVKNEFMETIKEALEEVKRKGKSMETKHALEKIVKEIDATLRLKEDWQQFEYHFDQIHGDFLNRLREQFHDLTPNEQKLCALLRLNLSTKEISNLMSISLRGVEIARYRLRKKLGLDLGQNLSKFILGY
jgi:ligand-binding sensor domain-containing protein/DNA-binding CsgD family transcriptional regulator